jgi:hypothetical protein
MEAVAVAAVLVRLETQMDKVMVVMAQPLLSLAFPQLMLVVVLVLLLQAQVFLAVMVAVAMAVYTQIMLEFLQVLQTQAAVVVVGLEILPGLLAQAALAS